MFNILNKAIVTVQYGCLAYLTFEYVAEIMVCTGPSMQPTIYSYDLILAERRSIRKYRIDTGDVVISRSPACPKTYICKRIMGMPGDIMQHVPKSGFATKYIPEGHVWLEGDNKEDSNDSRNYGPVPMGLLTGRVFFKLWPISDFGFIKNNSR